MKTQSNKQRLLAFVSSRNWTLIAEAEWRELRAALPGISEATIRGSGVPISPPWSGVNQHSLDELEASLDSFSEIYQSQPALQRYCRDRVIAAKDRARWTSTSPRIAEPKRLLKAEMLEWMLVWLDDPAMFPAWVAIRRKRDCIPPDPGNAID